MVFRVVGFHLQAIVAAIAQGRPDDVAAVLLGFAIEREHDFRMVCMTVAHTVFVLDD